MSQTIKTYSDLCAERERLQNLAVVQKQRMKDDWDGLKQEFNPFKKAVGTLGKMARPDKSNPMFNAGIKVATDLFITKFVLGKAGWVTKLAVPFVVKNYSTHLFAEKGKTFITRIAAFLNNKNRYSVREPVHTTPQTAHMDAEPVGMNGVDLSETKNVYDGR